jgi:pyruvate, orthophosphate dikinase
VQASGIVTASGGMAHHAALVARGWGIATVCGVGALEFAPALRLAGQPLREGDCLTIDGGAGQVYLGDWVEGGFGEPVELQTLRGWAAGCGVLLCGEEAAAFAPVAATEDDGTDVDAAAVLRALALLGFATAERIATALALPTEAVNRLLDALPANYLGRARRGLHVTPDGRAWLSDQLNAERQRTDRHAADSLYRRFMALDATFKQLVTDWQVKVTDGKHVSNDHADATYDDAVRARLAEFHRVLVTLLPEILALKARLKPFPKRLDRAAAAVASGDGNMIASPLKDSYHTIWFELHEELIHLAGRNRASEEARSGG